jgi:glycosyltransferase involved in cell wall biosynthesis
LANHSDHTSGKEERALRVCFISYQYPPAAGGGIGRFTADLATGFAAAGHDVHVISSQGGFRGVVRENDVWVHRVSDRPTVPTTIWQEPAGAFLAHISLIYREVMRAHLEKPFDIVSSPIWLAEGLLVAMDPRLTSVVSLHTSSKTLFDLAGFDNEADKALPILEAHCVRLHAHTHANSHAAVAKTAAEYSAPNGVVILPHGVADESPHFARTRGDDGRVRILVVGRLDKRKGADVLFDVIPKILSRFSFVEFILAGPENTVAELGHETLRVAIKKEFSARPEILGRIDFAGVVSDDELYQNYANADILLLPSRYESFGLSVIEAMSFGLPAVAWKAGGVCETVDDGETGILVDVGDRDGLVEAVGRLATDPGARRRCGAKARERYLSHFSTALSIPRTIDAYRKIAGSFQARPFQREAFAAQFAAVIESVTSLRGETALQTARLLIDGDSSDQPIDVAPPQVAVIVTCRDCAGHAIAALDSVLAQTYRNFDCVVVDDASSDDSAKTISNWIAGRQDSRFRLVRNESSRGQMASFAAGLAQCDGAFVAFLDAGDRWLPDFLKNHVGLLRGGRPAAAASCSDFVQADHRGRMLSGTLVGLAPGSQTMTQGLLSPAQNDLFRPIGETPEPSFIQPYQPVASLSAISGMLFRRSVLDAVMPRDPDNVRIWAT